MRYLGSTGWGSAGAICLALACSSAPESGGADATGGSATGGINGGGGSPSSGGTTAGGSTASGGMNSVGGGSASGGNGEPGAGGSSSAGTNAGGAATGGGGSTGGTNSGGSSDGGVAGGVGGAATGGSPGELLSLGMNDLTILVPLPERVSEPVLLLGTDEAKDGSALVPRALMDRLDGEEAAPVLSPEAYERLHLVAVRFDFCDHNAPGTCLPDDDTLVDASLRLVFQPVSSSGAEDAGFHAFYSIAPAEVPAVLGALLELSKLRTGPAEPLSVSHPLAQGNREYTEKLRDFVRTYSGESRLVRLTMNAQPIIFAAITWFFRGVERRGDVFEDMTILGSTETTQQVTLGGSAFFLVRPETDAPTGLALSLDQLAFEAASESEQRSALEAFVLTDNPLLNAPDTVTCAACHTSSVALSARSADLDVDPSTLPGSYETERNVSIDEGESAQLDRTLRALGWIGRTPLISRRVAHDTALVLEDLARFVE